MGNYGTGTKLAAASVGTQGARGKDDAIILAAIKRQTGQDSAEYESAYGYGLKSQRSFKRTGEEAPKVFR